MPERETREQAAWTAALTPSPDCVPIERLAETLTETESRHVSGCPRCQTELALFQEFNEPVPRAEDGAATAWIAQELRRRAAAKPAPRTSWWKIWLSIPAYRWSGALAAILVMAGAFAVYTSRSHTGYIPGITDEGSYRSQSVVVSSPVGDVDNAPVEFRWQPAPGAATYEIEVLEVDHHSLWKAGTVETHLAIPAGIRGVMAPGKTLLWEVTARNASRGTIATSGKQKFRVRTKKSVGGEL